MKGLVGVKRHVVEVESSGQTERANEKQSREFNGLA